MGLALYPRSIKNQAEGIINVLTEDNKNLMNVLESISHFTGEDNLNGAAWTSMKGQLSNHVTVVQGLICANESIMQDHETLISQVGDEDLVEDILRARIESLQSVNRCYQNCIENLRASLRNAAISSLDCGYYYTAISMYQNCIQSNNSLILEEEHKIQKLYDIENMTSSLFTPATSLYDAVESGISAIRKSWNPITGQYYIPNVDMGWKNLIGDTWEKRESTNSQDVEEVSRKLEEDYKAGKIDYDVYNSIKSGLLASGMAFVREAAVSKVQEMGSDAIADAVCMWVRENTTAFMDRGLVGALSGGGNYIVSETPSWLSQMVRSSAKYAAPLIGTALDFGIQKVQGEDSIDAGIKAVSHTAIGIGAAKVGGVIGTAIGGPVGTAIGAGAGFILGVAGSMAFDFVYDNWDDIKETANKVIDDIGDAVSGFFGGIGDAIFN